MKHRYWLFQRKGVFYVEDSLTGRQQSLGTREKREAERLRDTKNEAVQRPSIGLAIGLAHLAAQDLRLVQRSWQMDIQRDSPLPGIDRPMNRPLQNVAASARDRLIQLAHVSGIPNGDASLLRFETLQILELVKVSVE